MFKHRAVAVVIPALNEEQSIARVIDELLALKVCVACGCIAESHSQIENNVHQNTLSEPCTSSDHGRNTVALVDDIVLCDNGSTDNTAAIARDCGAIVIKESEKGYGAACLAAMSVPLDKDIVVFVDGDHSVESNELPTLLEPLFSGADLVVGSRTLDNCQPGALSIPQVLGNRLASMLMRLLWKERVTDLGPFRAISNSVLNELNMQDRQFGWTVEMQVKAFQLQKRVIEIPVTTQKRIGKSKISGTINGVIGAAKGILGTIAKLYWHELSKKYGPTASVKIADKDGPKVRDNSGSV